VSGRIHPPAPPAYSVRGAVGGTGRTASSVRGSLSGSASLDALITAQANKLDTLKLHKQGLMQSLFPAMEAG
jgi:hypothetical protein